MKNALKIGIIGDYDPNSPSQNATNEALKHSATALHINVDYNWVCTLTIENEYNDVSFMQFDAIWCGPGSPYQSMNGALKAIKYAREHDVSYIGTCGGFQHTLLEYARNVLGMTDADHEESSPNSNSLFITKLSCSLVGRIGEIRLFPHSISFDAYKKESIHEQFRCRYGLNPKYFNEINSRFRVSGRGIEGEPRIIELPNHKFFVATLFLPQLSSTYASPHPLVNRYLQMALV